MVSPQDSAVTVGWAGMGPCLDSRWIRLGFVGAIYAIILCLRYAKYCYDFDIFWHSNHMSMFIASSTSQDLSIEENRVPGSKPFRCGGNQWTTWPRTIQGLHLGNGHRCHLIWEACGSTWILGSTSRQANPQKIMSNMWGMWHAYESSHQSPSICL